MRSQEETDELDESNRINFGGTFKLVDIESTIDLADNIGLYFNPRILDLRLKGMKANGSKSRTEKLTIC